MPELASVLDQEILLYLAIAVAAVAGILAAAPSLGPGIDWPGLTHNLSGMLRALGDFLRRWQAEDEERGGEDDLRLAAAALLVRSIVIDGAVGPREETRLGAVLREDYDLSGAELAALINEARRAEREAVDLYHFTSVLQRRLAREERLKLVRRLWEMVLADGRVGDVQDNFVWRAAELLGVERAERLRLKAEAAGAAASA